LCNVYTAVLTYWTGDNAEESQFTDVLALQSLDLSVPDEGYSRNSPVALT